MQKWSPLEHSLLRHIESQQEIAPLHGKSLLLAVSGGLDSMVMWDLLRKLTSVFKYQLGIIYIHHGPARDLSLQQYRDRSFELIQESAVRLGISFYSQRSEKVLSSELEMRDFRKSAIENIRREKAYDYSVWAHHAGDFLETQMMRLIRGTGELGLEPMFYRREQELRPLLLISRAELQDYASQHEIIFCEDPSNLDLGYLRNWIRHAWLPELETKCPGALKSFSRSLQLLAKEKIELPADIFLDQKLSKAVYITLAPSQQKQAIAQYLRMQGQQQFSHNHVTEIIKRLDNSQNEHSFKVAQMLWNVSRDWIVAESAFLVNKV